METGPNRVALAEMIRQFLLIIVALGLTKAFEILADRLDWKTAGVFLVYVLICTRFLLGNWLYISKLGVLYETPAGTETRPHIRFEATAVFLTGMVLGWQSNYTEANKLFLFFVLFVVTLLVNATVWPMFLHVYAQPNNNFLSSRERSDIEDSILNDVVFFFLSGIFIVILWVYNFDQTSPLYATAYMLLGIFATINSVRSFIITVRTYLRNNQKPNEA